MAFCKRFLALFFITGIVACSTSQSNNSGFVLSPQDFQLQLTATPNAQLVDVRTPDEYKAGHLQQSMNINWNGDHFEQNIAALDKNSPAYVYCLAGSRSASAAEKMRAMGFTKVYEMKGGIRNWQSAGLPLENASAKVPGMTADDFATAIKATPFVLVDFYGKYCAPCKKMVPDLEALVTEKQGQLNLLRLEVTENATLSDQFKVTEMPVLILYKGGTEVWRHIGYCTKEEMAAAIK